MGVTNMTAARSSGAIRAVEQDGITCANSVLIFAEHEGRLRNGAALIR
jgi:hypothetical protein